jgi:hypothetical protein
MKYENIGKYGDEQFRRITGVKRTTFKKMLEILRPKHEEKLSKGGRKPKLLLEEMLLAALEYWREYRTYAHIAASYGIHESNMYRLIKWVEEVLIKDGTFSLPGKKALLKSDTEYEAVLIDMTETPVERPKRGSDTAILARRSGTP